MPYNSMPARIRNASTNSGRDRRNTLCSNCNIKRQPENASRNGHGEFPFVDGLVLGHTLMKVFGVPLSDVCEAEQLPIPRVTEEIFTYLENKGMKKEGIFRIPGNSLYVDQLKAYYDGESKELTLDTCTDIHAVAGLLKLYLRELPDPLLTHRFYNTFIAVQKNADFDYRMTNIRKLVNALPKNHKNLLTRLLAFLIKISEFSELNKMSEPNLAIVFGPNLLRPHNESMIRMIEDARHVNGVTLALIEEFEYLVTCSATVPHKRPQTTPLPSPRLNIEYHSPSAASSGSKRRAFKFNVTEMQAELNAADEEEEGEEENKKLTHDDMNHESLVKPTNEDKAHTKEEKKKEESKERANEVSEDKFKLEAPLEYITGKLEAASLNTKSVMDVDKMSKEEIIRKKAIVKAQLRAFDVAFESEHGTAPGKSDKEPLRPIYQLYRTLSNSMESIQRGKANQETPCKLEDDPEYQELKKEKRRLQCLLHKFQEDFVSKYGRKVQYLQDREPVQKEYEEYKELKAKILGMEEARKK